MGEIDDWYKQEEENLEDEFYEAVKGGKNQEKALAEYEKKSSLLRRNFESKYSNKLEKDRKIVQNMKVKQPKKEKFKHLEVEHFDFKFSWWQRKRRVWALRWFRFNRRRKLFVERNVSENMIYWYHKMIKLTRRFFEDLREHLSKMKEGIISGIVKFFIWCWEIMKKVYNYIKTQIVGLIKKIKVKYANKKKNKEGGGEEGDSSEGNGEGEGTTEDGEGESEDDASKGEDNSK